MTTGLPPTELVEGAGEVELEEKALSKHCSHLVQKHLLRLFTKNKNLPVTQGLLLTEIIKV